MANRHRRGQSLIESLILMILFVVLFKSLESCHVQTQNYYQRSKVQNH